MHSSWQKLNDWFNDKIFYPIFARLYWNFGIVARDEQGKPTVMRSRLPNGRFINYLAVKYGLKSVVSLEDDYDRDMETWLECFNIEHVRDLDHLSAKTVFQKDTDDLEIFLEIIENDFLKPMLIRCRGGADRTGTAVAVYRMEYYGWSNLRAWLEMLTFFHMPWKYKNTTKWLLNYKVRAARKSRPDV